MIRFKHPGGPPHATVMEALTLFAEEVIPKVRYPLREQEDTR